MCIISGHPTKVSGTQIFVAPLPDEVDTEKKINKTNLQLTVYCNEVSLKDDSGTMILPFPKGEGFEVFDLTKYSGLFKDLGVMWQGSQAMGLSMGFTFGHIPKSAPPVQILNVGSYVASGCSMEQLCQHIWVLRDHFKISDSTLEFIKTNYPTGYDFVLCKLDQAKTYHPFGYIHQRLPNGSVFIPTMHYHEKEHVEGPNFTNWEVMEHQDDADWDHMIYTLNCRIPGMNKIGPTKVEYAQNLRLLWEDLPTFGAIKECWSLKVDVYKKNHDLFAALL